MIYTIKNISIILENIKKNVPGAQDASVARAPALLPLSPACSCLVFRQVSSKYVPIKNISIVLKRSKKMYLGLEICLHLEPLPSSPWFTPVPAWSFIR